jgi:hypothetical protein
MSSENAPAATDSDVRLAEAETRFQQTVRRAERRETATLLLAGLMHRDGLTKHAAGQAAAAIDYADELLRQLDERE